MDGHLRLSAKERKTCLRMYRAARSVRRALILVLLAEGRSYRQIAHATLASPTLIAAVKPGCHAQTRFEHVFPAGAGVEILSLSAHALTS